MPLRGVKKRTLLYTPFRLPLGHGMHAENGRKKWLPKTKCIFAILRCVSYTPCLVLRGPMKLGYARVSTPDQSFALQVDALRQAGCTAVHQEVSSGARAARPVLDTLLTQLRRGDVLVVWKFDRLGRSLTHLVELVNGLMQQGVGLQSLQDPIDTTTPHERLNLYLCAALAEFERDLMRERTHAGLAAARAWDRKGGRPKGLSAQAEAITCTAKTL